VIDNAKKLFWTSRPVSWVNTAYPFAATYLLLNRRVDALLIVGTLYLLFPYNILMYGINDVFDYESDLRNPRKGGIEGTVLDRSAHKRVVACVLATNFPFFVALAMLGTSASNAILGVMLFAQLAYTVPGLRFKEKPFLDSITSSLHFCTPMIYAMALAGFRAQYWPYMAAFFLWGMASHAFGAVQDIAADRAGGIGSIATARGARWTVRFAAVLYATSGILLATQGVSQAVVGATCLLYIANVWPFWNTTDKQAPRAHAGWRRFMWLNFFTGFVVTVTILAVNL
jgi:4-hydroxybenzoate polyprenyltransferase